MKLILKDGTTIDIIDNSGDNRAELFGENQEETIRKLEDSISPILMFAEQTLEEMKTNIKPDELEISFGAEAGGEGGFFGLAKVHAKASIAIKMKWKPQQK